METRRWINQSQPQTMQIAVFLLYAQAVLTLLFNNMLLYSHAVASLFAGSYDVILNLVRLFLVAGGVGAGYLIANERKSGYALGLAVAALPLATLLYLIVRYQVSPFSYDLIGLMFDVALFALLVHPQSRSYERIWFK